MSAPVCGTSVIKKTAVIITIIFINCGFAYPGERPPVGKEVALINKSLDAGYTHWSERGVFFCDKDHIKVYIADTLFDKRDGVDAEARGEYCTVWLVRRLFYTPIDHYYPNAMRICVDILHEQGHLGGLVHTESGLMSERADATPWACVKAFKVLHKRARVSRRHRHHKRSLM